MAANNMLRLKPTLDRFEKLLLSTLAAASAQKALATLRSNSGKKME